MTESKLLKVISIIFTQVNRRAMDIDSLLKGPSLDPFEVLLHHYNSCLFSSPLSKRCLLSVGIIE